jgi:FkbM family methyltransferase
MSMATTLRFLSGLRSPQARVAFILHQIASKMGAPSSVTDALRQHVGGIYRSGHSVFLLRHGTIDAWAAHPLHERETHEWLDNTLGTEVRGILLDVGAYIGTFALRHRHSVKSVYAFEAHPDNYDTLLKCLNLSHAEDVEPVQAAVSDKHGDTRLFIGTPDTHSLEHGTGQSISVPATTIDLFLKERGIDPVDIRVIKVDVEGAELRVLRGATNTLAAANPLLILEANSTEEALGLAAFLTPLGYSRVAQLDGRNFAFIKHSQAAA